MKKTQSYNAFLNRTKSDVNLGAQSTTLCTLNDASSGLDLSVKRYLENVDLKGNKFAYIVIIQHLYGLRISEVLSIRHCHISSNGSIKIFGKKGSESRIIVVPNIVKDLKIIKNETSLLYCEYSRYFVYRQYKKLGFEMFFGIGKKGAVTHSFRYNVVKNLSEITNDVTDKQKFIGHKNQNNTKIYESR